MFFMSTFLPCPPSNPCKERLEDYGVELELVWVALSNGQLIADARNSDELKEQVGDTKGLVMISIG